ncbi:MAG: alpha/beta hydrolase [Pseudomonadota bacterium]
MVLRIVLFSAVAYLVLVAVMYVAQRKLLYLPTRSAVKPSYVAAAGLRYWPNESAPRGYIAESLETPAKGTVVVFHGNAGEALDRNYYRDALTPLGYRVVLAQYPGYGGRDGAPTE